MVQDGTWRLQVVISKRQELSNRDKAQICITRPCLSSQEAAGRPKPRLPHRYDFGKNFSNREISHPTPQFPVSVSALFCSHYPNSRSPSPYPFVSTLPPNSFSIYTLKIVLFQHLYEIHNGMLLGYLKNKIMKLSGQ